MENIDIRKYLPFAYIAGGILILVVLISWIIAPKYGSFELHKTPFITQNFPALQDGKIYNYNGAAFYSVNQKDPSDITVLSTGLRLPAVKKLYWAGDKGALIVFGDTQTDGSVVEKELVARGQVFDTVTTNYTWYLDFKTSTLNLVSETPIDSYTAYYSPGKQTFYFSTLPFHKTHGEDDDKPTLWTYSTDTYKREVLVADLGLELIRHIVPCEGREVCVIQDKDPDKQVLWTIVDGKQKTVADGYNSISSTGDPSIFIGEKNEKATGAVDGAEDTELQADVYILNLAKNEEKSTKVRIGVGASPTASTYDDSKKIVLYDDSLLTDNLSTFRNIAPNLFGSLQSKQEVYRLTNKDELTEDITGVLSRSTKGVSIIGGSEGGVYLHSPSSYNYKSETYDEKSLKEVLKSCISKYTKYYEYAPEIRQATIGVVFDDNFASTIKKFSTCIADTDKKAFVGQNYIFIGLSPTDGRFVTN